MHSNPKYRKELQEAVASYVNQHKPTEIRNGHAFWSVKNDPLYTTGDWTIVFDVDENNNILHNT